MSMNYVKPKKGDPEPWDIDCSGDEILTKQEFVKDCDVNEILKRCLRTSSALPGSDVTAVFGDVSNLGDFREMRNVIAAASEAFMELPAELRARFQNDPASLIDFLSKNENRDEAVKLGLIVVKNEPDPLQVEAEKEVKKEEIKERLRKKPDVK